MAAPIRGVKLSSDAPKELAQFYERVFGWRCAWEDLIVTPMGDPRHLGQYGVVDTGFEGDVFVSIEPAKYSEYFGPDVGAHRGLSFSIMVEDMTAVVDRVVRGGGALLAGPVKVSARGGFQALVSDPDGSRIFLWQPGEDWERDKWAERLGIEPKRA